MPTESDLRQRLRSSLRTFPDELLPIVAGYAANYHAWSTDAATVNPNLPTVDGTKSICRSDKNWYRITSKYSVVDGGDSWRIAVQFDDTAGACVAVGLTTSDAGLSVISDGSADWNDAATSADWLIRTAAAPAHADPCLRMLKLNNKRYESVGCQPLVSLSAVIDVRVDLRKRILTVKQSVDDLTVAIRYRLPFEPADDVWRPAVVLSGGLSVAIVSAADDIDYNK